MNQQLRCANPGYFVHDLFPFKLIHCEQNCRRKAVTYHSIILFIYLLISQAAGKYRQEGKTYIVQDGDIIFFKFNVSGGGKK